VAVVGVAVGLGAGPAAKNVLSRKPVCRPGQVQRFVRRPTLLFGPFGVIHAWRLRF
jgi:hypothetical protein